MSPRNGSVKKKFRARKTMTASCREQLATLKLKNSSKSKKTGKEPPNKTVQPPELICETNFTAQDNAVAKLNKSQGVFPNGLKVSIEVSQVDSGINIGCSYNETWEGISKKSEDVPFSHTTHFVVRDFNNAATEDDVTGSDQVPSPANEESQAMSEDMLHTAESTHVQEGAGAGCEQTGIECSTISENLNASITVKIIEDQSYKKTLCTDDVTPTLPSDTDIADVSKNELDPSNCVTDGPKVLNTPSTLSAISDPEYDDDAVGGCEKKRACSENGDVPAAKRAKTSNSVLLDEIQCLIDRRINILFKDHFEEQMQTLIRQVDVVRKDGNHANDIARHLRRIRRLERRLKCAVHIQKKLTTCSTDLTPITSSPVEICSTNATSDTSTVLPPAETETRPRTPPPELNTTSSNMELVVLSDNESERPSSSKQGQSEDSKNSTAKVDRAAMKKILESIKEHRKKARSSQVEKAAKNVIDLTDDEEQRCDKDQAVVTEHSRSAASPEENVTVENTSNKRSAKKNLTLSNNGAALSCDVNEEQQSVPASPQSENPHESVAVPKMSATPELQELKPPQKPQLRLAQVQNPKGIALSWNVTGVDPSCAPAKSYCLYVHQGDPSTTKKLWKKIGEIKALPLPMACTLTQFVEDTTYSFAMRAKDAKGRFGPLCDIQSTTLKLQGSSKKS
ncbi:activating transcription factor 7-interacting protein 2 isoform X2 [Eleutherodactylus coqui]